MTGRTERQYRRRAHYPARINFGVTARAPGGVGNAGRQGRHLRCRGGARLHRGRHRRRTRPLAAVEAAQRTKGRRTVNRRRRTIKQLDTLDEQLIEVLRADRPQSVRHLFYRMTDPRLAEPVDKTEHGYKLIIRRCLGLRRSGPYPVRLDKRRDAARFSRPGLG